jgi:hypothetical protein
MSNKESHIPYKSIMTILRENDISNQLRLIENIRYDRYRKTESPQQFAELLGSDIRFVSHPGVTYNIAKKFINSQNSNNLYESISGEEADILLTASIVHDWGELKIEGLGHGDVTFDQHSTAHETVEETIFEKIINRIGDLSDRNYILRVYKEAVEDKNSRLGRMFNAIERIGYLNTALRAYTGNHGARIENWSGLVGNVFSNQIIQLLEYQKDYRLVKELLESNSSLISNAFKDVSTKAVLIARDDKPSYDVEKFSQAKSAWEKAVMLSG